VAMGAILLVARADDLGSTRSANRAINETLEAGVVRNVSVLVPGPFVGEAAALLAGRSDICFGLHTAVNSEWDSLRWPPVLPASEAPSLVDDRGMLCRTTQEMHDRGVDPEEVFREMDAQLDRAHGLGFGIVYADTHMGWTWIAEGLADRFDTWCRRHGLVNGDRVAGLAPLRFAAKADRPADRLVSALRGIGPGAHLVVGHPSYDDTETRGLGHAGYPGSQVAAERNADRLMFADSGLAEFCRDRGIAPARYDETAG